jgi:hypothetical protein
MGHPDLRA